MFEQGMQLKKQFGEENVFDFSLETLIGPSRHSCTMESLVKCQESISTCQCRFGCKGKVAERIKRKSG